MHLRLILRTALAAGLAVACAGCAKLSPKTPRVTFSGTETLREFDAELFLECVEPESQEMHERKLQRSKMDRPLYYSDKADRDQPASLEIPTIYTLTLDGFREVEQQGRTGPPRLTLQLRERTKVLKAKVYQVQTPMVDTSDKIVKRDITVEKFPRYYDWNWYPDCAVRGKRPVHFAVRGLEERPGVPDEGTGTLDQHGMIVFELQPYLKAGAASPNGLTFVFTCEAESLHAEVRVPQDVFTTYLNRP